MGDLLVVRFWENGVLKSGQTGSGDQGSVIKRGATVQLILREVGELPIFMEPALPESTPRTGQSFFISAPAFSVFETVCF